MEIPGTVAEQLEARHHGTLGDPSIDLADLTCLLGERYEFGGRDFAGG